MASARQSWPRANEEKNEIFLGALKKAFEAGLLDGSRRKEAFSSQELEKKIAETDFWGFDVQESPKLKRTSSAKKLKKVTPKKPSLSDELASAEFNPECCRARFWNQKDKGDVPIDQPGHGMQCWRSPDQDLEGGYCEKCFNLKTEPSERTSTTHWFGDFDKPLSESPGEKKDGTPLHDWPAMKKLKPKKEKKTSEKKEKKPKKEKKLKKVKKLKKEKKPEENVEEEKPVENVEIVEHENAAGEKVEVEIHRHDDPVVADAVEEMAKEEAPDDEEDKEDTLELSDDELGEDTGPEMVEYDHDGFSLLWNKKTNELIDPDDMEVMGAMVADEAGNWKPQMKEDESEEEEEDSDSDEEK